MSTDGASVLAETASSVDSIVPIARNPIYIVTPPYTRVSAGVTVLHLLCHYLNLAGHSAYIVHYPPAHVPIRSLPAYVTLQGLKEYPGGMIAPLITHDIIEYYDSLQLTPIVIYPEVFDNPFNAPFFGRYLLNYPGKLNTKYQERENFNLAYTRILADHTTQTYASHPRVDDVLFVPTTDLGFWNAKDTAGARLGTCFYAGKMRAIHGHAPANVPLGATEILRSDQMTRDEIRNIFRKSEAFYCYEDTALGIEALLCGCPTVFVKNPLFSGQGLASIELGTAGMCSSDDPDGLLKAKATVREFEGVVRAHIQGVPAQIAELGNKWRAMAQAQPYQGTIQYPFEARLVLFDRSLPMAGEFSEDDGLSDFPLMAARSRGFFGRLVFASHSLTKETMRASGVRGTARRVVKALGRHGPFGLLKLLYRAGA